MPSTGLQGMSCLRLSQQTHEPSDHVTLRLLATDYTDFTDFTDKSIDLSVYIREIRVIRG